LSTVSDSRSALEGFSWELVRDLSEQGLVLWLSSSEGVETDGVGVEVELATDEAVRPELVDGEGVAEQADLATIIGSSEEDDLACGMSLKVLPPRLGEGLPEGGCQDAFGGSGSCGGNESGGLILKSLQGVEMEASPDLGLPAAVVALDGGLEAGLARGSEDGGHLQGEAKTGDTAEVIGILMGSLEPRVVVELGVAGQTDLTPVFEQCQGSALRRDGRSWPRGCQAAVKGDGIKDFDVDSAFNDKAGDDVDAIALDLTGADPRQVPTARRGWAPRPSTTIQNSPPLQDATDRANRGDLALSLLDQFSPDRDITVLSQIACLLEFSAKFENLFLGILADPIGRLAQRTGKVVRPVHAIQPLFLGAINPAVNRTETESKTPGNRADRFALTDGSNHGSASSLDRVFLKPCSLLFGRRADHIRGVGPTRLQARARRVEADGVWKAAEYGAFPHPLENAARFPHLPHALTAAARFRGEIPETGATSMKLDLESLTVA
jgi:hypothetical protein